MPGQPAVSGIEERELTIALARGAIDRAEPDELLTFDEAADEYFANPADTLEPDRRDEAVGFGLDLVLLTPYAIAVAAFTIQFLADVLKDAAKEAAVQPVAATIRRMLHLSPPTDEGESQEPQWTEEQRRRILVVAKVEAQRLGLPEQKASVLGHAIVGVLGLDGP
ncbi:hypothetical protein IWX75_002833 [Arthrobacter sp. CAN_A6]|uniref:hypothetical protein n=1 Tax=Arthrobacter sp. CAN_A6 TaxID=2787721 RepID=UPI0018CBC0FC